MGTNYYAVKTCDHCGHEERLHIGKDSSGWVFGLHVIPEKNLNSPEDWRCFIQDGNYKVINEYGDPRDLDQLMTRITNPPDFVIKRIEEDRLSPHHPYIIRGPRNLLRLKVDGVHCVGHGEFWDLMPGEFS